ncbi:MAG: gliding motility protein GldM [Bacteroidetes bacterium]|nr:gliding motility protein GldM [Bacteroidota bacterium]
MVLTAMLALNVSAEILNAFKTVNNSIIESNTVITDKNKITYRSMDEELKDNGTKLNAEIWVPKAKQAQQISDDLYSYIQSLKDKLVDEAGPYTEDGVKKFREDDLDAATRLMDEQGNGKILYDKLKTYKEQLINALNLKPEEASTNPSLAAEVKTAKETFSHQLPLNLTVPESQSGNPRTSDSAKDWTENYFHMTPAIASLTILSKFQNDVKSSEAQIIDFCHKKIGEVQFHLDKTGVIVGSNSTYLMPGDKLTVYAGVGAFSSASKPTITIDGKGAPVDADGKATLDIPVGGSGKQSVKVNVTYTNESGKQITETKDIDYTVGTPSGVAISADKMNVLYIMGEQPNPLTITGGSGSEKLNVSFANPAAGVIKRVQGSSFEAFPKIQGEQTINVSIDGKVTGKKFRVKLLPDPAAFVGSKKGGSMPSAEFKVMGGLIAKLENSEFEAPFRVVSYKVGAVGGGISQYSQAVNEGNRWTGAAEALIKRATPGTQVFFDEIRVIGPDGRQREITPIFFSLK